MLESLFSEVAELKVCNLIKKRLQHRCFPVNIVKFLRTPFSTEHLRWLLLYVSNSSKKCLNLRTMSRKALLSIFVMLSEFKRIS